MKVKRFLLNKSKHVQQSSKFMFKLFFSQDQQLIYKEAYTQQQAGQGS